MAITTADAEMANCASASRPRLSTSQVRVRSLCDFSLIPHRCNYEELKALEFSHLQTNLASTVPAGCIVAGTSLWYCSNSLQTIMLEFDWILPSSMRIPTVSSIDCIRSNLVPCRSTDDDLQPLSHPEILLCFGAMQVWLDWEKAALEAISRSPAPRKVSGQRQESGLQGNH